MWSIHCHKLQDETSQAMNFRLLFLLLRRKKGDYYEWNARNKVCFASEQLRRVIYLHFVNNLEVSVAKHGWLPRFLLIIWLIGMLIIPKYAYFVQKWHFTATDSSQPVTKRWLQVLIYYLFSFEHENTSHFYKREYLDLMLWQWMLRSVFWNLDRRW